MKFKHVFLAALATAFAVVSCKKDEKEEVSGLPSLEIVSPESMTLDFETAAAASKNISFKATRDWSVQVSDPWIKPAKLAGYASSKNITLKVSVEANAGYDRSGTLTVTNMAGSRKVTITQKGGKLKEYKPLGQVASLCTLAPTSTDKQKLEEDVFVKGVVVSSNALSSLNSNKILYLQDETGAVQFFLSAKHEFAFGDVVETNLNGAVFSYYGQALQIGELAPDAFTKTGTQTVTAKKVTVADFLANKYLYQYIELPKVQATDEFVGKHWWEEVKNSSGSVQSQYNVNVMTEDGDIIVVRTGQYFMNKEYPLVPTGSGPIRGLGGYYNGTIQLSFAQETDWADMTGERFSVQYETKTVDEVFSATEKNVTVAGQVVAAADKSFVINDGGSKNLLVYLDKEHTWKQGDNVTVSGSIGSYGLTSLVQIVEPTVAAASSAFTPLAQEAKAMDVTAIAAYAAKSSEKVSIDGKVVISGSYINIELEGGVTAKIQGSVVGNALATTLTNGQVVKLTGYFGGMSEIKSSGIKNFNIIPTEVGSSATPNFLVSTASPVEVGAKTESTKIAVVGNVAWSASSNNAEFVLDKSSGEGDAEITVTFGANSSTEAVREATITVSTSADVPVKSYAIVIKQAKASATGEDPTFVKVTAAPADWTGTYLLVYETKSVAFDGKGTEDVVNLNVPVTISDGKIVATDALMASTVSFEKNGSGYAMKTKSGKYLSAGLKNSSGTVQNGTVYSDTPTALTLSIDGGDANIVDPSHDNYKILYNASSGQDRFRFYKPSSTTPKPVQLYKLNQ